MMKIRTNTVGVDQGEVVLFSDFDNNGDMWHGEGRRQSKSYVEFSEPFFAIPAVNVGLSMWDISNIANTRVDIQTEDLSTTGFWVVFRTWGDSRVARVRVCWQAIGALRDEDDWDLY